jgi:hypothetical protein
VWERSFGVWDQEGLEAFEFEVARCTVERLMGEVGLERMTRGRRFKITTTS